MIQTIVNAFKVFIEFVKGLVVGLVQLVGFVGNGSLTIIEIFNYLPAIFLTVGSFTLLVLIIKFAIGRGN